MLTIEVFKQPTALGVTLGEPTEEDSLCRWVLRRLVLLCPHRVVVGKVDVPDLTIFLRNQPLKCITLSFPMEKPPFCWIGGGVDIKIVAPHLHDLPAIDPELHPDLQMFKDTYPDRDGEMLVEEACKRLLPTLIESRVCIPLSTWIQSSASEE